MWKISKQTENVKMNLGLCDISNKIYVKSKAKHLSLIYRISVRIL